MHQSGCFFLLITKSRVLINLLLIAGFNNVIGSLTCKQFISGVARCKRLPVNSLFLKYTVRMCKNSEPMTFRDVLIEGDDLHCPCMHHVSSSSETEQCIYVGFLPFNLHTA